MQPAARTPPAMTIEIPITPCGSVPRTPVRTIEDASAIFCALRDRLDAGSSGMSEALIRDETGVVVAHVSYNGRVWWGTPKHWTPDSKAIFNP